MSFALADSGWHLVVAGYEPCFLQQWWWVHGCTDLVK